MAKEGMIYLYSKDGDVIAARTYKWVKERDKIVFEWSKRYGARFSECYLQIAPNANDELVGENGMNITRKEKINYHSLLNKYSKTYFDKFYERKKIANIGHISP